MNKLVKIFSAVLLMVLFLLTVTWFYWRQQDLKIYFFNVGQGDAILIRTPSRQNIIIDGGPDNSLITKLGQALPFYDRTIDLMVLTHPHDDHLVGLIEVLKRYRVRQILSSGINQQTSAYEAWLKLVEAQKIPVKTALAGQTWLFGSIQLKVFYPLTSLANQELIDLNETSVVLKLGTKPCRALLMGDLPAVGEQEMLKSFAAVLKSEIIKVGHHGSETSSGVDFLKAVEPAAAIISVGLKNSFGHPARRVINRLGKLKAVVWRTDLNGDLIWRCQKQGWAFIN